MPLNTLPGVKGEINDGQLRPRFVPQQPKVTLIGSSNNPELPVGEPFIIETDADAQKTYNRFLADGTTPSPSGPIRKPSELTRAIAEVRGGGAENIEVVVLPDPTAMGQALEIDPNNLRRFQAQEALFPLLKETPIDAVVPVGATIDASGLGVGENFGYQLANLCHQSTINERSVRGYIGSVGPVAPNSTSKPTLAQQEAWVAALEAFDTTAFGGASFTIGDGVTDAGGDGVPDNFAFWGTQNELIPTGTPPRFNGQVEIDGKGQPVDIGKYITVFVERVRFFNEVAQDVNPTLNFYDANGVAAYAGLRASLPSRLGTTNRVLPGAVPIRPLSPTQVERLQRKRFVALRLRPTGYVVNNGITFAYHINDFFKSDFTQETTFLITQDALSFIRTRAVQYLGGPNNAQVKAALESDIDDALKVMQRLGALQRYNFQLIISPAQAVLGRMRIEVTLVPA
ncbi:MAG: hypothetical protein ACREJ6_15500, partial [Candidatus Methylomirabilis sp.]